MLDLNSLNLWGVLAAAAVGYALGGLWFSPKAFGKLWAKSLGKAPEQMGSPAVAMGVMAFAIMLSTIALALVFQMAGIDTLASGLQAGALVGIGFVFPIMLSDAVFPGHLKTWWWITATYRVVCLLVIGGILGATAPERPVTKLQNAIESAGDSVKNSLEDLGKTLK
ncbi:MAG: hypothetical protein RL318_545 [Fibrobacterota bacterium]|jgi:hypothetical protein